MVLSIQTLNLIKNRVNGVIVILRVNLVFLHTSDTDELERTGVIWCVAAGQ